MTVEYFIRHYTTFAPIDLRRREIKMREISIF